MTEPAPIIRLDAFRRTASPLMEREMAALTPELQNKIYRGMLNAFRGPYNDTWHGIAFQLGMHAYQPDYPLHKIVFDVFGGDESDFPKLVTRELDGTIRLAHGYEPLMQQIINLRGDGRVELFHPFRNESGMSSEADPEYAAAVQRYRIPHRTPAGPL